MLRPTNLRSIAASLGSNCDESWLLLMRLWHWAVTHFTERSETDVDCIHTGVNQTELVHLLSRSSVSSTDRHVDAVSTIVSA